MMFSLEGAATNKYVTMEYIISEMIVSMMKDVTQNE